MKEKEKKQEKANTESEEERGGKNFLFKIISILLIILLLVMIFPTYFIRINARFYYNRMDKIKTTIHDIVEHINLTENISFRNFNEFDNFLTTNKGQFELDRIRTISTNIVNTLCSDYDMECYVKALFYFTRDYINYINDPIAREYIQLPTYTLKIKSGDCDDHAVLFSLMLSSIGIKNDFIFTQNHVYNKVYIIKKGFLKDKQIVRDLDTTCKTCEFE